MFTAEYEIENEFWSWASVIFSVSSIFLVMMSLPAPGRSKVFIISKTVNTGCGENESDRLSGPVHFTAPSMEPNITSPSLSRVEEHWVKASGDIGIKSLRHITAFFAVS